MPFLLPALPAIIGGVTGAIGAIKAGKKSPQEQQSQNLLAQSQQQGMDYSKDLFGRATGLFDQAQTTLNPVTSYWQRLLSGDRGAAFNLFSPQIQDINQRSQAMLQGASQLTPRGGGRATLLSSIPFSNNAAITNLMSSARPTAANALQSISGQQSGLGANLAGISSSFLGQGTQAGGTLLNNALQQRQMQAASWGALAQNLYEMGKSIYNAAAGKQQQSSQKGGDANFLGQDPNAPWNQGQVGNIMGSPGPQGSLVFKGGQWYQWDGLQYKPVGNI